MNLFCLLTEVLAIREDSPSFYRIENNDGKVWLMPVSKLRTAMNLYQPSGVRENAETLVSNGASLAIAETESAYRNDKV